MVCLQIGKAIITETKLLASKKDKRQLLYNIMLRRQQKT